MKKAKTALAICTALSSFAAIAQDDAKVPTAIETKPTQPNIVYILADDYRYDFLSGKGHEFVKTPNIDRLMEEGVSFDNAFVTSSLSSPSRASMITGLNPQQHGVQNNFTKWDNKNVTYFEYLKKAGYQTAFIGKWHMPGGLPALRGLDEYISFEWMHGQGDYYGTPYIANGVELDYGVAPMDGIEMNGYITDELTQMNNKFMENSVAAGKPFSVYLSHKAVHLPMIPDEEAKGRHKDQKITLPEGSTSWASMTDSMFKHTMFTTIEGKIKDYAETAEALDQQIGVVLDKIDELGIADNTIVIFAGDNGYMWGEHRLIDKRWAYEESMRIPFIVRYPDGIKNPGTNKKGMMVNIDLAPTLLDMAGIDIPDHMQGKSLKPILDGEVESVRNEWVYKYFKDFPYPAPEQTALRTERYKLITFETSKEDELYDLIADPEERHNLIDKSELNDIKADLYARLDNQVESIETPLSIKPVIKGE
ncbi:sulfatase-like hydrolase/transferase [Photobacterium sagamiensis]|uniref:sulfatase-like hydrolase/transferase n=1 Tax=Photobacterium sagamiensis TaxID=2910241 RepID=UPI003D0E5621